jgi:DNA polymerase III subunit delta'
MNKVNNRLYFYENYFQSLNNLLTFKNLPQSIIFSGQAGLGKKTFLLHFFAFHLLNSSEKETYLKDFTIHDQETLKKLSNNEYVNFKIVKKKKKNSFIQIDQIRELIKFCSYEASFSSPRFILILNIEDLNSNATNSLLKLLEEPPKNTYFFLIRSSHAKIYETIQSRCHKINIKMNKKISDELLTKLLSDFDLSSSSTLDHFDAYDTPGMIIKKIIYIEENNLIDMSSAEIVKFCYENYKKNKDLNSLNFGNQIAKKLFLDNYNKNFSKYKKLYSLFEKRSKELKNFNSSIDQTYEIVKRLR